MKDIRKDLLDELLEDYERPEDLLGEEGVLKSLQKALMERAFGSELTDEQLSLTARARSRAV